MSELSPAVSKKLCAFVREHYSYISVDELTDSELVSELLDIFEEKLAIELDERLND